MKLLVAGSRGVDDVEFIESMLDGFRKEYPLECIVSGLAKGPDTIAKNWADKNGIPVMEFPAEWDRFGKAAGPIRNSEMLKVSDCLLAFWDGKSSGTKDMIKKTQDAKKPMRVIVMPKIEIEKIVDVKPLDF